jgi:DNA-binding MarR family transcriptional regulator
VRQGYNLSKPEREAMNRGQELRDSLGYQLQLAYLSAMEDLREELAPFGLTPAKLTALLLIRDNPGCDQTALGRALGVNRSSAMKIVNMLVDRSLVERRPGRDLRTNALHLTPAGDAGVKDMLTSARVADQRLTERLSAHDRDTLLRLLTSLAAGSATEGDDGAS